MHHTTKTKIDGYTSLLVWAHVPSCFFVGLVRYPGRAGGIGDRRAKAKGGGESKGNTKGSVAIYDAMLESVPGMAMPCSNANCDADWRKLAGVKARHNGSMGVHRGIYVEAEGVVYVHQEKHRADKGWFRPNGDATLVKAGVTYSVKTKQDSGLRTLYERLQNKNA